MYLSATGCDDPTVSQAQQALASSPSTAATVSPRGHGLSAGVETVAIGPADLSLNRGQVVVRGSWGTGPGEFGKRDEAVRPGPMSLAVGADRSIYVLDQVNRRVQRFDSAGQLRAAIPVPSETAEDIALIGDRLWALVFEPGPSPGYSLASLTAGDAPARRFTLPSSLELVTGLFVNESASEPELWVEERHDTQRLVFAGGHVVKVEDATRQLGRPLRRSATGQRVSARLRGSHRATVFLVRPGEGVRALVEVRTQQRLLGLHALATAPDGSVYLGLLVGDESGPPDFTIEGARRLMLVWRGAEQKSLVVQLADPMATEAFRTTAVGDDGALYQLHTTERGLTVRRWELPPRTDAPAAPAAPSRGGAS